MKSNTLGGLVPAAILICLFSNGVLAQQRPAVSGLNGKFEFSAGALTLPTPSFVGRAAGALTVPLGDRFGLQADFSVSTSPGYTISAALHAFTRDPSSYLLGGSAGFVKSSGALVIAAGPEAELYRDRWTVEAWAGAAMVDPVAPRPTRFGVFALGTLAYYPTDNWRVSVGLSSLDNYAALQVGSEYLLDGFNMPVAVTGEARLGQDGAVRALVGLRGYIGPDPDKSLIDRQREDDPPDLGSALYGAAGKSTLYGETASPKTPAGGEQPPTTDATQPAPQTADQPDQGSDGQDGDAAGGNQTNPDPGDATDPVDPIDPGDVTQPADPTNPGDVTDPTAPTNPGDATDPTDPTDPGDVTDPTDPTDPGNVTDPIDPADPGDVSDPTNPDPGDATDPTDPSDATDPTDPADPDYVTDPADPTDPGDVTQPTDPTNPGDVTDPPDPADPGDATDPTDPGDVTDPTDPTDPGDVTDPTDPADPGDVGDPTDPTDPNNATPSTDPTIEPAWCRALESVGAVWFINDSNDGGTCMDQFTFDVFSEDGSRTPWIQ